MYTPQARIHRPRPPGSLRRPSRSTDSLKAERGAEPAACLAHARPPLATSTSCNSQASASSSSSSIQSFHSTRASPGSPARRRLPRISASPASRAHSAERDCGPAPSPTKRARPVSPPQPSPPPPYGDQLAGPLGLDLDVVPARPALAPTLSATLLLSSPPDAKEALAARRARSHPRPIRPPAPADVAALQAEADERIAALEAQLADARSSEDAQRRAAARLRRDLDKARRELDRAERVRSASPEKRRVVDRPGLRQRDSAVERSWVEDALDDEDAARGEALDVELGNESEEGDRDGDVEDGSAYSGNDGGSSVDADADDATDISLARVDDAVALDAVDPVALAFASLTRHSTASGRARPALSFSDASTASSMAARRRATHVSILPGAQRDTSPALRALPRSPYPRQSPRPCASPFALAPPAQDHHDDHHDGDGHDDSEERDSHDGRPPPFSPSPTPPTLGHRGARGRSPSPLSALAHKMESMRTFVELNLRSLGSELGVDGDGDEAEAGGGPEVDGVTGERGRRSAAPPWAGWRGRSREMRDVDDNLDDDDEDLQADDALDVDALALLARLGGTPPPRSARPARSARLARSPADSDETDDDAQPTPMPIPAVVSAALAALALHLGPRALAPPAPPASPSPAPRGAAKQGAPAWWLGAAPALGKPDACGPHAAVVDTQAELAEPDPPRRRDSGLRPLILPSRTHAAHASRASGSWAHRASLSSDFGWARARPVAARTPSADSRASLASLASLDAGPVGDSLGPADAPVDAPAAAATAAVHATPRARAAALYRPRALRTVPGRAVHDAICWLLLALDWSEWALLCLFRLYLDLRHGPRRPFGVRQLRRYYS